MCLCARLLKQLQTNFVEMVGMDQEETD